VGHFRQLLATTETGSIRIFVDIQIKLIYRALLEPSHAIRC